MSYELDFSGKFKKDVKRCLKRNYKTSLLDEVMELLRTKEELPQKYKPHKLSGNYKGRWECHIKPDWLLIWKQDEQEEKIYLERTGTHSDLFQ